MRNYYRVRRLFVSFQIEARRGASSWGGRRHFLQNHPLSEIAEPFRANPFPRKAGEERAQLVHNVFVLHGFPIHTVQPRAGLVASQVKLVLAGRLADEPDLGHERTRAAVWAAGHANDNLLVL